MSEPQPLVGVVLVTHGRAGEEMLAAAEAIVGRMPAVRAVATVAGEAVETLRQRVSAEAAQVDSGAGVLVLADLIGSTPANACAPLFSGDQPGAMLCGLNMAMLIKLSTVDRRVAPPELAELLRETGVRAIRVAAREAPR